MDSTSFSITLSTVSFGIFNLSATSYRASEVLVTPKKETLVNGTLNPS